MSQSRLWRSAGPLVFGRAVSAVIGFALPVIIARRLNATQYGTYKQIYLVANLALYCLQFGLAQSLFYFVPRATEEEERRFCIGQTQILLGAIGLPAAFWSDAGQTDYRMGVSDGKLSSVKAQNGKAAWSFTGDAQLITQPVVINDMVAVGSSAGTLYLLDAASGDVLWSEKVAAGISHEQQGCCTQPWTAIAAGDGELAIPGGDTISLYSPAKKK